MINDHKSFKKKKNENLMLIAMNCFFFELDAFEQI